MRAPRRIVGLCVCAALLRATAARGESLDDIEAVLDEPVVQTASKSAVTANRAPATSTTITAEDLRRYGIHSLDEAINYLSLGMVTQNPLHSVEIGARGVLLTSDYGNHVLLLVNGHAMNEQWDGTAYFERGAGIPFELIDHIEVILGAGSVLYGSNAMLGVINVITKRAKDFDGAHAIVEGDVATSLRTGIGFGHEFSLAGKPAEVTGQFEYYTQTGPTFRFGPQSGITNSLAQPTNFGPNSPLGSWGGRATKSYWTQIPAAYLSVSWNDFQLDLRGESYKRGTPYINPINMSFGDFNDPAAFERDQWLTIDLKHRLAISQTTTLRSRLYADGYSYLENMHSFEPDYCALGQNVGCKYVFGGKSQWAGLEEQLSIDWTHNGQWATLVGVDGRVRHVSSDESLVDDVTKVAAPLADYAKRGQAIGVYLQQMVQPLPWLSLNAGARMDADDRFAPKISPRAAANVDVWSGGMVKLIYSTAFRAPTYYEQLFTDKLSQIAATSLRPEGVTSGEASFEQRVGAHRFLVGAFESWWTDMVVTQALSPDQITAAQAAGLLLPGVTGQVRQFQNVSSISNWGFNVAMEGSLLHRDLRYALNFTGAYARKDNLRLTVAPQVFGNARVSYDLPGDWPVLALVGQAVGSRPADGAYSGGFSPVPYAPVQVELRATVSGAVPGTSLLYRASVDVATASTNPYVAGPATSATQTSAQLAPVAQRTFTLGIQYDFH